MRRVAKWTGATLCLLIAATWTANYWWSLGYWGHDSKGSAWFVCVGAGAFQVMAGVPQQRLTGWNVERNYGYYYWKPRRFGLSGIEALLVPLWMPFVAVAAPTAWLFWLDRRRARPGHCLCGYDLAGLAPGAACPECGASSSRSSSAAARGDSPRTPLPEKSL